MITTTLFLLKSICYILSVFLIMGSCLLISTTRLIYSIFCLVFIFFSGIWFFIIYDAEYALFIFLVVYLGAVVVFFIFVIMLLNPVLFQQSTQETSNLTIIASSFILLLFYLFSTYITGGCFNMNFNTMQTKFIEPITIDAAVNLSYTNIEKIGFILYTDFGLLLVLMGFLLLVAILGCVLILKPVSNK